MRRLALAASVLMVLTGPAVSAGLGDPVNGETVNGETARSGWTGCYAGGHAGGLWGTSDKWIVRTQGGAFEGQSLGGHDLDHVIGGVQAGCDYQFAGGFVIGIGGDYGWTDARGTHPSAREFGVFYHSEVEGLGTVTGRAGYGWDRFLAYVEAGFAWERVSYSASTIITGTAFTARDTRSGWTLGGGGEYALTRRLSAFVEFSYQDFGTKRIRLTPQLPGLNPAFVDIEDTANVVRAGINIRFGP